MKLDKPHMSVAVIGHVSSGKSTLAGHLLYKNGSVGNELMEKVLQKTAESDKPSLKYAWIMDKLKSERERGQTHNFSYAQLDTSAYNYTVIDTPGHRKYIKNMISGTSLADTAIIVVSSIQSEFEADISGGMTFESAVIAFSCGVRQIIVCLNKMDEQSVNFSRDRFEEKIHKILLQMKKAGFSRDVVHFIPISAWSGDNLTEKSANTPWYKGQTLLEALNKIKLPKRYPNHSLRLSIHHVYDIKEVGTVIFGKIHLGTLRPGMNITIAPSGLKTTVVSIEMHHEPLPEASSGDIVAFKVEGIAAKDIKRGYACGDTNNNPPSQISSFVTKMRFIYPISNKKIKYSPVLDCNATHIPCKIIEFRALFDISTGKQRQLGPQFINSDTIPLVVIQPLKPLYADISGCYAFSRILLRDYNKIVAYGTINQVTPK